MGKSILDYYLQFFYGVIRRESRSSNIAFGSCFARILEFFLNKLSIPVYSIGEGEPCDGQLIICGDMLGMLQAFTSKFISKYANVAEVMINAMKEYVSDVKESKFPEDKHVYQIKEDFKKEFSELKQFLKIQIKYRVKVIFITFA